MIWNWYHTFVSLMLVNATIHAQDCHLVASTLQFQELQSYDVPIIIKGGCSTWPALQKWTLDFLRDVLQEVSFPQGYGIDSILSDPNSYIFSKIDPVSGFLISTEQDNTKNTERHFQPLLDVDQFPFIKPDQDTLHHFLLIGGIGSGLCFHNHEQHAFNALIKGSKKWYFYPPNVDTLVIDPQGYPHWWRDDSAEGRYEFANSILSRLEERPLECFQEIGDLLFVPKKWHHMVINQEKITIAVNAIKSRTTYF